MTTVHPSLEMGIGHSKPHVVSILPIADKVKNLHVILCDICNAREATYDVFSNGIIKGIPMLKRCCDYCINSI